MERFKIEEYRVPEGTLKEGETWNLGQGIPELLSFETRTSDQKDRAFQVGNTMVMSFNRVLFVFQIIKVELVTMNTVKVTAKFDHQLEDQDGRHSEPGDETGAHSD